MASVKNDDSTYTNAIFETTDFQSFRKVLYFNSGAFVRSFEYLNGSLFFGCGDDTKANLSCGEVLRLDLYEE